MHGVDRDPGQVPEPTKPQDRPGSGETYREQSDSLGEEQPIADKRWRQNPRLPMGSEFGPHNPRRSGRSRKPPDRYR